MCRTRLGNPTVLLDRSNLWSVCRQQIGKRKSASMPAEAMTIRVIYLPGSVFRLAPPTSFDESRLKRKQTDKVLEWVLFFE